jgi:hypothetical protein
MVNKLINADYRVTLSITIARKDIPAKIAGSHCFVVLVPTACDLFGDI